MDCQVPPSPQPSTIDMPDVQRIWSIENRRPLTPATIREVAMQQGWPMQWDGLVNGLTNPRGYDYGTAHFLFSDEDYQAIDWTNPLDIVCHHEPADWDVSGDAPPTSTVFHRYTCIRSAAVIKSVTAPAKWVTLADRRWVLQRQHADRRFNLRRNKDSGSTGYDPDTINGSTPWTWEEVVEELWDTLPTDWADAFPGLASAPSSTPENLDFQGVNTWRAICQVLTAIGQAIVLDPVSDTCTIVDLNSSDTNYQTLIAQHNRRLLWYSGQETWLPQTTLPSQVSVSFPHIPTLENAAARNAPFRPAAITKTSSISPSQPDTTWPVTDTMFGWSSRSTLQSRADEIAMAIEGLLRSGAYAFERHYSGILPFLPSSDITHVTHVSDGARGMITVVQSLPVSIDWPKLPDLVGNLFGKIIGTVVSAASGSAVVTVTHASPGYEYLIGTAVTVIDGLGCILDVDPEDLENVRIVAWRSASAWLAENRCCIDSEG